MLKDLIEDIKEINEETDIFGTYNKALSITEFIELEDNRELLSENNLIAIYGEWGTGKSCLMQTIYNKLSKEEFDVLWFDTWKYEKDDNLAFSLFKYIAKDRFLDKFSKLGEKSLINAYEVFKSLASGIEINLGALNLKPGDALEKAQENGQKVKENFENKKCLWEKIDEFEKEFKKITFPKNKRLIVFLDDLDRCESENIVTLVSAVKLLLSLNKNIIFIIGIDKKAVTLALRNKYNNDYNKADEYLEKIFPINFEISNKLQTDNLLNYVSKITDLTIEDSKLIIEFFETIHFTNARHIKKVLRKYYLTKNILSQNIDIKDKYFVILILYMIILNIFYNDEYKATLQKDKDKMYDSVVLTHQNNNTGQIIEQPYSRYYEKSSYFFYNENKAYNIMKFLIRFSSIEIAHSKLPISPYISGEAELEIDNWLALFKNNICRDFITFSLKNYHIFTYFLTENSISDEIIYEYLCIIDNIM